MDNKAAAKTKDLVRWLEINFGLSFIFKMRVQLIRVAVFSVVDFDYRVYTNHQ